MYHVPRRPASSIFGTISQLEAKRTTPKEEHSVWGEGAWATLPRLCLLCRSTWCLWFLLHLRHCRGASTLLSLGADAIRWASEEGAGGEDAGGDGAGTEYCPDRDRPDARSTAGTALAAALVFLELRSRAYDLQDIWEEFKFSRLWGFGFIWGFKLLKCFYNQIFFTETKKCPPFGVFPKFARN